MRKNPFEPEATNTDKENYRHISYLFREIFDYAEENPHFQTDFVESLFEQFQRESSLSEKQYLALENIHEKWVCR